MRIGIDARELCGRATGVGRHLSGLLQAWSRDRDAQQHSFVLYAPEALASPLANADIRKVPGAGGTIWEQTSLARAAADDRLDVFFAPGYTAPLRLGVPIVVLVHDVSFAAHPEWFRWREGMRRRLITRWSSRRAALVLAVSDAARRDIVEHLGVPADRVRRIYPGVMAPPSNGAAGIAREAMVLFVGSIFNRRHLPDLIQAFAHVARTHDSARLVIAGDNRTYPRQDLAAIARAARVAERVTIRPYAEDAALALLYRQASAFALLSEYEGFGHPPLEALTVGVPPILLDTPVAREVCGDAARYVTLDDRAAISRAIEELLFDHAARARVLDAAPSTLRRYSWDEAGRQTLHALTSAATS